MCCCRMLTPADIAGAQHSATRTHCQIKTNLYRRKEGGKGASKEGWKEGRKEERKEGRKEGRTWGRKEGRCLPAKL